MLFEFLVLFLDIALTVIITLFAIPVGHGYHYFAPLLILAGGYVVIVLLLWCVLYLLSLPYKKEKEREKPSKFANFILCQAVTFIVNHSNTKVKINYKEPLPNERFLIVANHKSKFDPMILEKYYGIKYQLAFISKPTNFKVPVGGSFMRGAGYFSIDRYDKLKSLEVIQSATKLLEKRYASIGVFPEGTRNTTKETLLPFHEGVFSIAIKANAPIVVATFKETENIHRNFPFKFTHVKLDILKVYYPDDYKNMIAKEISDDISKIMLDNLSK